MKRLRPTARRSRFAPRPSYGRRWAHRQALRALSWLTLVAALPTSGMAEVDLVQATTGTEPVALMVLGQQFGVQSAAGGFTPIELPPATALKGIEPLAGGWVAVGSRWRDAEMDLFLVESKEDTRRELPVPAGFSGPPRRSPRLVVAGGDLEGLVWLEGLREHELSVWAARWDGRSWGAPELVSPAGPGAQLAPSVAVLDDETWLLVWAAVDGEDDEIMWSRRGATGWTPPARLHPDNSVPDITPAVTPVRGGAMVVWSSVDQRHFRLRSSRFDGESWSAASPPFGLHGSHRPLFLHRDHQPVLLYRTSWPAGWAVVDHDLDGRVRRRTFLERSSGEQPFVDVRGEQEVRFLHPPSVPQAAPTERLVPWEPEP